MSIESYSPLLESSEMEKKIYPERASFSVNDSIEKLKKLHSGEIKPIELSEKERVEILTFENELGVEFEEIFKIKVNSTAIHPEYLLDNIGRANFRAFMGFDVEGDDIESVEKFICRNRGRINSVNGINLSQLEGQSKKYSENELLDGISRTMTDSGEIDVDNIETYQALSIVLNPEEALNKLQKLRSFKKKIKSLKRKNSGEDDSENYNKVVAVIIEQYVKSINEVIVDQFGHVVKTKLLANKIGEENLSTDERMLLSQFSGLDKFVSVYSRFDKFIFGTDGSVDENGNYKQVGEKMEQYAQEMEEKYIENECTKKQKTAEKGLDFDAIVKKDIPKDTFSKYAEAFLDKYGQKSSMPSEEFDPKRKGSAPDGKWQFVTGDRYNSMAVSKDQNIIKSPLKNKSVQELITILLGHEFVHFIQSLNQDKIGLKLYSKIGGDRRMILAEGAAMSTQKQISEEIFGISTVPLPNYVKAMSRKINGGNYLDCVKAYYECSKKIYLETTPETDQNLIKKNLEEKLGVAIRGCKRLFKNGEQLNSKEAILSKSKDTVYLEQLIVMDRLREQGLEKFAFIRGINLDSLAVLLQNGFIKESDIETLDIDYIRSVWEELKAEYVLKNTEQN